MRTGVLVGLLLAAVVMCVYLPQPCEAQYETLIASVLGKLTGLWHNNQVDFMGHTCQFRRRPSIRRFKLYHNGKFWCPGWAPFSGTSRTKSRSGSAEAATRDFVRKALQHGLITEEAARIWVQG